LQTGLGHVRPHGSTSPLSSDAGYRRKGALVFSPASQECSEFSQTFSQALACCERRRFYQWRTDSVPARCNQGAFLQDYDCFVSRPFQLFAELGGSGKLVCLPYPVSPNVCHCCVCILCALGLWAGPGSLCNSSDPDRWAGSCCAD